MRRVIFTADDYGMCEEVNAGIEDCLAAETVRSTCVMPNMPFAAAATRLRTRFPSVSIGLHWTVSQGKPILPHADVPTLVDEAGEFWDKVEFRRRWQAGLIRPHELRSELKAQYDRFELLAGAPCYWNTHQNTHVSPGLFQLFVQTGLEIGIPAMRSHRRILVCQRGSRLRHWIRHPSFLVKGVIISLYCAKARARGMRMPTGLIYSPGCDRMADLVAVASNRYVPARPAGAEIVFHPATKVVPGLFGGLTETRVSEWKVLRDSGLHARLLSAGVESAAFDN